MPDNNNDPINALPEYRIRTMKDDIDKLERKPTAFSAPPESLPIAEILPPVSSLQKDANKIIKSSLPEIEDFIVPTPLFAKTSTEAKVEKPKPEPKPIPKPEPISTPKPAPPTPSPKPKPLPAVAPTRTKAKKPKQGMGIKKILRILAIIILIALIVFIGGFIYWKINQTKSTTPQPPTQQTNNEFQPSTSLIPVNETKIIKLENNISLLNSLINEPTSLTPKTIQRIVPIKTTADGKNLEALSLSDLIKELNISVYPYVLSEFKNNYTLFLYAQNAEKRLGIIIEIKNTTNLNEQLKFWEKTMFEDLKNIFLNKNPQSPLTKNFLDNKYKDTAIRFINFPSPDLTIDYAIINNLFLLSTSKELMYETIDRLKS